MKAKIIEAYLQGAFHDGTRNSLHKTFRFCQKERKWLEKLRDMLKEIGFKSWIYQEGRERQLYALETTAPFLGQDRKPRELLTSDEKVAYIRGYFDADLGIHVKRRSSL